MGAIAGISGITGGYLGSTPVNALYLGSSLVWANSTYTYGPISGSSGAVITIPIGPAKLSEDLVITVRGYVMSADYYEGRHSNFDYFFEINPAWSATFGVERASGNLRMGWFGGADVVKYNGLPTTSEQYIQWDLSKDGIYDKVGESWIVTGSNITATHDEGSFDVNTDNFQWNNLQIRDNNEIIFNGVGAIRDSDGQGGLWDTITKTFYTDPNHPIYQRQ